MHFFGKLFFVMCVGGVLSHPVFAGEPVSEMLKVVPADGSSDDRFGNACDASAGLLAVGAPFKDISANASGAVYVFDTITMSQVHRLTPDDGAANDHFGSSVAIDGGVVVVGSPHHDALGSNAGAVYVFDVASGQQLLKLTSTDIAPDDEFGYSVAIGSNFIVVGARFADDIDFVFNRGAAYVFDRSSGAELFKLIPDDGHSLDEFGSAVEVSGNTIYVGSPGNPGVPGVGASTGAVYVFDAVSGNQSRKMYDPNTTHGDDFGLAIGLGDGEIAIGARWNPVAGTVSLFDAAYEQISQLSPHDGLVGDLFGTSVSIEFDNLLVGAVASNQSGNDSGSAYVFSTVTGQQFAQLIPTDGASQDHFGQSAVVFEGLAYVGAPFDDDLGARSGAVYVFQIPNFGPCNEADFAGPFGELNFFDISAYLVAFMNNDPTADLNSDGAFNFSDISAYLNAFGLGCP